MNLGILQCAQVQEKFAPQHGQYPDMFIKLLKQIDSTLSFTSYNVENAQLPAQINSCDAYLITGSHHGVNDDLPWLPKLLEFICQLHVAQKKVIGICFGHQLIAKALGGRVSKSPNDWSIGMSTNQITQQKFWMTPTCKQFNLLVSHQDQVVELPPGAEILASNATCPIYMMQLGNNLSVQGHPEFSHAYSKALIESRKSILDPLCYEQSLQSLRLNHDNLLIAQWIINFMV